MRPNCQSTKSPVWLRLDAKSPVLQNVNQKREKLDPGFCFKSNGTKLMSLTNLLQQTRHCKFFNPPSLPPPQKKIPLIANFKPKKASHYPVTNIPESPPPTPPIGADSHLLMLYLLLSRYFFLVPSHST